MTASTDLDDTLANIRARAEAATSGPWEFRPRRGLQLMSDSPATIGFVDTAGYFEMLREGTWVTEADMAFVAAARTDVPRLLDLLDEQRAVIARVRDWLAAHPTTHDVRQTEGYWRAQNDLRALLDGADTTTTDRSEG
ncbi:hypothetical protein F9L07_19590 [Pimelobacter simplex]|uniref:Uncharacterized protein n=1 Tax=Nocardioides simplex TaxID=2045 RepID=A0A7J5DW01_NOCSI|nr:hypothetical protein [Pimelobacter simplex]KAB2809246.1 hypothetical protein F9L07_19590 [Pimelobacter simplex]